MTQIYTRQYDHRTTPCSPYRLVSLLIHEMRIKFMNIKVSYILYVYVTQCINLRWNSRSNSNEVCHWHWFWTLCVSSVSFSLLLYFAGFQWFDVNIRQSCRLKWKLLKIYVWKVLSRLVKTKQTLPHLCYEKIFRFVLYQSHLQFTVFICFVDGVSISFNLLGSFIRFQFMVWSYFQVFLSIQYIYSFIGIFNKMLKQLKSDFCKKGRKILN